jgi:hypothetical protein
MPLHLQQYKFLIVPAALSRQVTDTTPKLPFSTVELGEL